MKIFQVFLFQNGHSRLITNGLDLIEGNNQPIIKNGIIGVHNGIITNIEEIRASLTIKFQENTILILRCFRLYLF